MLEYLFVFGFGLPSVSLEVGSRFLHNAAIRNNPNDDIVLCIMICYLNGFKITAW
jgi:hypothetical protein